MTQHNGFDGATQFLSEEDLVKKIQHWYSVQCDLGRGNKNLFHIGTLDNPGWDLKVSLLGTSMQGRTRDWVLLERTENDWAGWMVKDNEFGAAGGAENLVEILTMFLDWIEGNESPPIAKEREFAISTHPGVVTRLQRWYASQCDGDWEHAFGADIRTIDGPGWAVIVDLADTPAEGLTTELTKIQRTESDWVDWKVKDKKVDATGGPGNLLEMLNISVDWIEPNAPPPAPDESDSY